MRRELIDRIAPVLYGAVDFGVIVAPAITVKLASDHGGMGDAEGIDLIATSTVLAVIHAIVAGSRLRSEEQIAVRRADMWIAAIDALVVLALGITVLLLLVLYGFTDEHASLADRGYPLWVLWAGIQLVAVAVAEATGRFVFWWLEPHPRGLRPKRRAHGVSPDHDGAPLTARLTGVTRNE